MPGITPRQKGRPWSSHPPFDKRTTLLTPDPRDPSILIKTLLANTSDDTTRGHVSRHGSACPRPGTPEVDPSRNQPCDQSRQRSAPQRPSRSFTRPTPPAHADGIGCIPSSRCPTPRPRPSRHRRPILDHTATGTNPKRNFLSMNNPAPPRASDDARWWSLTVSNRRPPACKAGALPAELRPPAVHEAPQGPPADPPPTRREATKVDRCSKSTPMVGLGRLERPTSRLSSARSNQLSYKPTSPLKAVHDKERETKTAPPGNEHPGPPEWACLTAGPMI